MAVFNCKICKEEVNHASTLQEHRKLCEKCLREIETKEKKTYGWLVYHLLKITKNKGKFITNKKEFADDKYGLQQIYVNKVENIVKFIFYFGRSFCHRPELEMPLNIVESNRDLILEMIEGANRKGYIRDGKQKLVEETYKKIMEA